MNNILEVDIWSGEWDNTFDRDIIILLTYIIRVWYLSNEIVKKEVLDLLLDFLRLRRLALFAWGLVLLEDPAPERVRYSGFQNRSDRHPVPLLVFVGDGNHREPGQQNRTQVLCQCGDDNSHNFLYELLSLLCFLGGLHLCPYGCIHVHQWVLPKHWVAWGCRHHWQLVRKGQKRPSHGVLGRERQCRQHHCTNYAQYIGSDQTPELDLQLHFHRSFYSLNCIFVYEVFAGETEITT